jgi:hypothetical protein
MKSARAEFRGGFPPTVLPKSRNLRELKTHDQFPMEAVSNLTLDLPYPPSLNATSKRLGSQDASVQAWIRNADVHRISNGIWIAGTFIITITWKRKRPSHGFRRGKLPVT